jgi:hypothetical protein
MAPGDHAGAKVLLVPVVGSISFRVPVGLGLDAAERPLAGLFERDRWLIGQVELVVGQVFGRDSGVGFQVSFNPFRLVGPGRAGRGYVYDRQRTALPWSPRGVRGSSGRTRS